MDDLGERDVPARPGRSNGVRQDITGAFTWDPGTVQVDMSLAAIHGELLGTYDEEVGVGRAR
jgi:hypothetical protein